jgi:peptidoglycan/LPS O-acetylase OafA/YrhL
MGEISIMATKRDVSLDLIRAVAVTLVIFHHFFQEIQYSKYPIVLQYLIKFFINYGAFGVQLFFAVSGYIMISRYNNISSLPKYVLLRYTRLIPMLGIVVFFDLLLSYISNSSEINIINVIPSILIIDPQIFNVVFGSQQFHWVDNSFWTLFVEIRFYLIFGFLMKILSSFSISAKKVFLCLFFVFTQSAYFFSGLLDFSIIHKICFWLFIPDYFFYFLIGTLLYSFHSLKKIHAVFLIVSMEIVFLSAQLFRSTFALQEFFSNQSLTLIIYFLCVILAFSFSQLLCLKIPKFITLANLLGTPSYISYLMHQNLFLHAYPKSDLFKSDLLFCILLYFFIIAVSFFLAKKLEPKLIKFLRIKLGIK